MLPSPKIAVIVPTMAQEPGWKACLAALGRQHYRDFEIVLVDNSGRGATGEATLAGVRTTVIHNRENVGYGAAVNAGIRITTGEYVAPLNDDAVPDENWLREMVRALETHPDAGMCAPRILLAGTGRLDSAGMVICRDGSSKQRGENRNAAEFHIAGEVLLPSGCAALYRRAMLAETGLFDEDFFLYCEDTDLGLRARRLGWRCLYAPTARVEHHYSATAGPASPLKAYYVERNRLMVLIKTFPARLLWKAPLVSAARYFWHLVALLGGEGAAGAYASAGHGRLRLVWHLLRAHGGALRALPRLISQRASIARRARLTSRQFARLLEAHSISAREIARL